MNSILAVHLTIMPCKYNSDYSLYRFERAVERALELGSNFLVI